MISISSAGDAICHTYTYPNGAKKARFVQNMHFLALWNDCRLA